MMLMNDFLNDYLLTAPRLIGLSLIIIGIVTALVAKRLARIINKTDVVDNSDKTYTKTMVVAFVFIVVGMIVCIF